MGWDMVPREASEASMSCGIPWVPIHRLLVSALCRLAFAQFLQSVAEAMVSRPSLEGRARELDRRPPVLHRGLIVTRGGLCLEETD